MFHGRAIGYGIDVGFLGSSSSNMEFFPNLIVQMAVYSCFGSHHKKTAGLRFIAGNIGVIVLKISFLYP